MRRCQRLPCWSLGLCLAAFLLANGAVVSAADVVAVIVNKNLKPLIQDRLDTFVADLTNDGYAPTVVEWDLTNASQNEPRELRDYLKTVANLKGAIFVGDLPVIWYYNAVEYNGKYPPATFPFDLYFMDLTVTWQDTNNDVKIDGPSTSGINPTIWVSRIKASNMGVFGGVSEADLVKRYFDKNHRFRTGALRLPDRGLLWADTDWNYYTPAYCIGAAYTDSTRVTNAVAGITTDRTDWISRWPHGYETEFFMCHSNEGGHYPGGSGVSNSEIAQADIRRLFWNCWNCSSANYTAGSYVAGVRLYTPTYGIIVVGSTKTGSMLSASTFYGQLAGSTPKCHGEAFRYWFSQNYTDVSWHRGMVLLGDGTLKLGRYTPSQVPNPNAPTISSIPNVSLYVNQSSSPAAFTVGDVETPAANLTVWGDSSNCALVPVNKIFFGGSGANRTVWVNTNNDVEGTATITVFVCDIERTATRSFTVTVINRPPAAAADTVTIEQNHSVLIPVLANDSDPDSQPLTLVKIDPNPSHGTAGIEGNSVRYTPNLSYIGGDSFTYTVQDSMKAAATATVNVTVVADVAAPSLVSAACLGTPTCVTATFSERMQAGGGAGGAENPSNYAIDRGVAISAAVLQADGKTVKLTVAPGIEPGITYTLTANSVRDLANNAIAPNAQKQFQYTLLVGGVAYEYYHGSWASGGYLPDFNALTPVKTGYVDKFDLSPRTQDSNFAFRYTGKLRIETGGNYTFYTNSDDGSQLLLFIDGVSTPVVNNDGPHGMQEKSGAVSLVAGIYDIRVTFCQGGGGFGLTVSWEGPGIAKQEIPGQALYHIEPMWEMPLTAGYNLVALPSRPATSYTTESLAGIINAQGGSCVSVVRYVGGGFETHPVGTAMNNFAIEVGRGYFLRCQGTSLWRSAGTALNDASATVVLEAGYNLIGLPVGTTRYTAESAGQEINAQGGGATQIIEYDAASGQFVTHPVGTAVSNFALGLGRGYFVRCTKGSAWTVTRN
jgi:hypothetical protein